MLQELVRSSPSSWCHKAKMATAHTCTDANWNESGKSCDSGELGVIQDMIQKRCEESRLPWSDQKSACMRRQCQREWFHFFFFHGQRFRTFVLSPIFVRNFLSGLMFGCSNYRKVFTAQCDLLLFSSTQSRDKHISPSWHLLSLKGDLAVFSLLCGASLWFKDDMSVHDRMPYALLTYVNI